MSHGLAKVAGSWPCLYDFGGAALAGVVWQAWTNPESVRRLVLAKFGQKFPGAIVSLQSAQMQLFGGIAVTELRMTRRGDPDQTILCYIPSGIIYPDKEGILDGRLALRKVELNRPFLHLIRERDGSLNVKGICASLLTERAPLVVIRRGTLVVEDRGMTPQAPLAEIKNINMTIVNDPLPTLMIQGSGQCDVAGALKVQRAGSVRRVKSQALSKPHWFPLVRLWSNASPALARTLPSTCANFAVTLTSSRISRTFPVRAGL